MKEHQDSICIVCDRPKPEGIHICAEFICSDCEKEIVDTDVQDEKYPFFIHQLKRIWYKKNA